MTLADIVKELYGSVDNKFKRPNNELREYKDELDSIKFPSVEDIDVLKKYINSLAEIGKDVNNVKASFTQQDLLEPFNKYVTGLASSQEEREQKLQEEFNAKVQEIREKYSAEMKEHNDKAVYEFEKGNEVYLQLEEKRKIIAAKEAEIINVCRKNGVTTSDVNLNNESYPLDQWNDVYDAAIAFTDKTSFEINPIRKARDWLDNDVSEAVAVGVLLFLCFMPWVLDIVAIIAFIGVFTAEKGAKKKMEQCAILLGLLYNVQPLEMGYKAEIDESELVDLDELINNSEEAQEALAWLNEEQEKLSTMNPEEEINEAKLAFRKEMPKITEYIQSKMAEFNKSKKELLLLIKSNTDMANQKVKEILDNVKKLGDNQSKSIVYSTRYHLGMRDGAIPEYVDTGMKNLVIRPSKDEEQLRRFIQAMLINAFCNVNVTNLNAFVSDPNNLSRDLIGFYNKTTDVCFKPATTAQLDEIIKPLVVIAQDNIRQLRGQNLQEYNKECEETGKSAIAYNLLIILSQPNVKSEELIKFMEYSASAGVFIWIVTEENYDNTFVFNTPFEGVPHPMKFDTVSYLRDFGDEFGERIKKAKPAGLPWKKYLERAFDRDRDLWKETTNEFVWFEPGFINGDPSKYNHYTLGNSGDVHGVIAGTSGAGKSVFINQLICNMTLRHSPEELRLWLVDFKGSEFSLYLNSPSWPYQLPHIDACLCTSDPDYSKSLFTALREESERRYNLLKNNKYRNIVEWNDAKRKEGHPELIIPRIIFIADEFQVIFTKADGKTIASVTQDITIISKVARAAGVHLVFASQSMKGTVSDDILNMFTLRFCLRCELEVSQQILGTPYAGNIREKFGFLYVRSIDDPKKELQNRYKTPFQTNQELKEHIKDMDDESKKRGFKKPPVIEYDEQTKHSVDEIDELYASIDERIKEGKYPQAGTVFLGRRMVYSSNLAPNNFIITPEPSGNIITAFMNQNDLINWFLSFQRNIDKWQGPKSIIYNSQSDDLGYLCYFDNIVPKNLQKFADRKTTPKDILDMAEKIYKKRVEENIKDTPVIFICLGWSNTMGFGIDPNFKVVDKFGTLLQTCGEYHIHFVFIDTKRNDIPTGIIKGCNYRICGKVDEKTAMAYCESDLPSKATELKDSYAFLYKKNELTKFKIYQSKLDREVKSLEVVF